jgi:SAM-dependent methyltransferase
MARRECSTRRASSFARSTWISAWRSSKPLPFRSGGFDGILCSSVIEYVPDPERLLREIQRTLRDDGVLVISIATRSSIIRQVERLIRRLGKLVNRDMFGYLEFLKTAYHPSAFFAQLEKVGLHPVESKTFDPLIPSWIHPVLKPSMVIVVARKVATGKTPPRRGAS